MNIDIYMYHVCKKLHYYIFWIPKFPQLMYFYYILNNKIVHPLQQKVFHSCLWVYEWMFKMQKHWLDFLVGECGMTQAIHFMLRLILGIEPTVLSFLKV